MKKLTAGIFTVLMGLVTVNAAEAAVASKGYVDEMVGGATADITALTQTVADNKAAAEKLVSDYKAENDAKVLANTNAIAENAADIAANTALIGDNADAIAANTTAINEEKSAREAADTALDGRLDTAETNITTLQGDVAALSGDGENSVATQIANAVTEAKGYTDAEVAELADGQVKTNTDAIAAMDAAYKAADTQTLTDAKAYADQEDAKIESTIGTVAEGKTVVGMIAEAQTAATYDDTEVRGLISDNAEAIATKLTDTTTISADGKYVLTAVTVGDDTTYAWELIEREAGTAQE